ncbi:MAG TPA: sigma-54 dependent transcriptional regulator [Polyangia bacterium]|nr:sigma-54 dependent transcriptional regulator [Polyangia bacterium]
MTGAVLIVEDEPGLRQGLVDVVRTMGGEPLPAAGIGEARVIVASRAVDCVLLDIRLRDGDGLDYLNELRRTARGVPVILATAYGDSERTIRAMRDGAFDYLTKPFDLTALKAALDRAVNQRALARQAAPAPAVPEASQDMVGTSAAMLAVWKLIGRAAGTMAPVLVTGETGTGKELVARAIHAYSPRAREPFVAINLAALPPTLIESELFGHERGAFTGATTRRAGRFELAQGGSLFLDEIGDLDPALQAKLLRVVQEGTYERVGGDAQLATDARIIAATNRPVRPGAPGAALREELYYRLAVIEIELPPLRARPSDIPLLVAHALRGRAARAVSEAAMQRLLANPWPGNVRELFHVLERAAVLCGTEVIDVGDLPETIRSAPAASSPAVDDGDLTLNAAVASLEKRFIARALERAKGNRSAAARLLGIGRPQLYAKLQEHGLGGSRDD